MSKEKRDRLIEQTMLAVRAAQNAVDQVDEAAGQLLGVNRTDLRCLDLLEREGRVTAGRLAELAGLTTGAVTALLDRLEGKGYVRRLRDEGDRRRVLVEITPRAVELAEQVYGPIGEEALGELEGYTDEQLTLLRDHYRREADFLAEHVERVRERARWRAGARSGRRG